MFQNLESVELKKQVNYLKEGAYLVTIKSLMSSDSLNKKPRTPYIEYTGETESGQTCRLRFMGSNDDTSDKAKEIRNKIMKQFLFNCGVTSFMDWVEACKNAIGKQVYVCLIKREYWVSNGNDKPQIKHTIDYHFSSPSDKPIQFDTSFNKPLSNEEYRKFNEAMKFAGGETQTSESSDLPF
jgi:hypothetical protein